MSKRSARARPDAWTVLIAGSAASLSSGLALACCSRRQSGSAAAALNGPSQWLWGEHEAYTRRASMRHTLTGYAIHHAMSVLWAGLHLRAFRKASAPATQRQGMQTATQRLQVSALRRSDARGALRRIALHMAQAAATTTIAYLVDYHLMPARLRPGFRKHLESASLLASYAAFAAGLALGCIACERAARL